MGTNFVDTFVADFTFPQHILEIRAKFTIGPECHGSQIKGAQSQISREGSPTKWSSSNCCSKQFKSSWMEGNRKRKQFLFLFYCYYHFFFSVFFFLRDHAITHRPLGDRGFSQVQSCRDYRRFLCDVISSQFCKSSYSRPPCWFPFSMKGYWKIQQNVPLLYLIPQYQITTEWQEY